MHLSTDRIADRTVPPSAAGQRRGFTLPELLVVISLISIVLGIAAPKVNATVVAANARSAAVDVTAHLAMARHTAIRRGSSAVFHFTGDKAWVSVVNNGAEVVVRDTLFLADKYGVATSATIDTVRYDSRGFANLTSDQTFSVTKSSVSHTVCVSAAGLILNGGCTL